MKKQKWTPNKIRKARLAKGWTQRQLAEKMGIKTITVSFYEQGRINLLPSKAMMLEMILAQPE